MSVELPPRGNALLLAHCASFDPDVPTARVRLDDALGPELAHKLVSALAVRANERGRSPGALRAWAVFAA